MITITPITVATDSKTPIFVYGTLKRGFPNHNFLEPHISANDVVFIGHYKTLNPYPLVLGPSGVPVLINRPGSGYRVTGELYSVSSQVLPPLDALEGMGRGHYERLPVSVTPVTEDGGDGEVTEVEVYFADEGYAEEMWEKCGKGSMEEYLSSHVDKYVCNWDVNLSFTDYVRIFLKQINTEVDLESMTTNVIDKVGDLKLTSANITDKVIKDTVDLTQMPLTNNLIEDKVDLELTAKFIENKVDLKRIPVTYRVIEDEVDFEPPSVTNKAIKV